MADKRRKDAMAACFRPVSLRFGSGPCSTGLGIPDMRILHLSLCIILCLAVFSSFPEAGERGRRSANPPLLTDRDLPPPRPNPDSNRIPDRQPGTEQTDKDGDVIADSGKTAPAPRRSVRWRRDRKEEPPQNTREQSGEQDAPDSSDPSRTEAETAETPEPGAPAVYDTLGAMRAMEPSGPPPTPEAVEEYRKRLEDRLLERYNNMPEHGGKVAQVRVVLSRPLESSIDGSMIRAEFDQLVFDHWGKRLPQLEKEYYQVTFGVGGVQQVRSDPSIRVGLDMERTYSEQAPLAADPFKNIDDSEAFQSTPKTRMPNWWRPEFPELE